VVGLAASLTGESKTEAIRRALEERKRQLAFQVVRSERKERLIAFLEREVWPAVPKKVLGRRITRAEEDRIPGHGPEGM